MKFVNKISVISLIVLMFSFMNVAQAAPACQGAAVSACSKVTDQSTCANSYLTNSNGSGTQCKWGNYCYNGGAVCGTANVPATTCGFNQFLQNGKCYNVRPAP